MPRTHSRELAIVDSALCDACGLCIPLCPPGAIHLRRGGLLIDEPVCTGCHKCIAPCPVGALVMVERGSTPGIEHSGLWTGSGSTPVGVVDS